MAQLEVHSLSADRGRFIALLAAFLKQNFIVPYSQVRAAAATAGV